MAVKTWSLLLINIVIIRLSQANHHDNALNVPQVLLPYAVKGAKPTTFVLRALKGCFHWSSTKPNVATISPIYDKLNVSLIEDEETSCSQASLITVKLNSPEEDTTVVLAEEEGTGYTLRCDVFVDSIHKIEIATTTRELLLGESPEVFDVYAYDLEGNLFSSLGSQAFKWEFEPVPRNKNIDPLNVLRFLWFQDSTYDTEAEIYELERQHTRGYSALVEGINTGEAIVTAKLSNPEYKNVKPSSVTLTVIDNVMLVPPFVHIMVHQTVKYSAQRLRRGTKNEIPLPSDQYSIKILNDSIGILIPEYASVRGKALGNTKVQLVDKNMEEVSAARRATATIHVVEPGKLGFIVYPGKVWILEKNRVYEMQVVLFDEDNNRIEVTDNTVFDSVLFDEYFEIYKKSDNGSYFHVKAKKVGKTTLSATFDGIKYSDQVFSTKKLFGEQIIEIFDPIVLNPDIVVFPWYPLLPAIQLYKYQLNATGGSGSYSWYSVNSSFASVSKKGVVMVGNVMGNGQVKVSDLKSPIQHAFSTVLVLPPHEMLFVAVTVEVEVGKYLLLPLAVSAFIDQDAKKRRMFTDCRKMQLDVTFSDPSVFRAITPSSEDPIPEKGCMYLTVEGLKVGHATVTASYTYGDVVLRTNIVIAAYTPVVVVDPIEFAVVTLGSSKVVIAEGGPLPWILDVSQYYELMSAEEDEWVEISPTSGKKRDSLIHQNTHHFKVTCTHLGEQLLTIQVGNKPTAKNKKPASLSATARFLCVPPTSLKIIPVITLPLVDGVRKTLESCRDEFKRIPIRNNRQLRVNLVAYDANGNVFDDTSSLLIDWSIDDTTAATFVQKDTLFDAISYDTQKKLNGGAQAYQLLNIKQKDEPVVVSARINGYRGGKELITSAASSTQLHLMLISEPQITPNSISLFAHSTNNFNLNVAHGTDNFILKTNDNSLANLKFNPPDSITVFPQQEGQLKIYLYDSCLDADGPAEAHLTFSDIHSLQITVSDKVEIGQTIKGLCQALDQYGRVLNVADVNKKLKLQLKTSTDILEVSPLLPSVHKGVFKSETHYNLTGKTIGVTSVTCHATSLRGNELSSKAEEVQVFSAIELEPKYVLLIVGSTFQIDSFGGPRPQSTTSFSLDNDTVAHVSQTGLVTARVVGKTIVTGKAKGLESITGKDIIYSQDQTIVEVIQLKGFKISLKTRNLVNKAELSISAVGITDESPFTFATSLPYLKFHWSSSNHKVAVVESLHYKAGVSLIREQDFRAVLKTMSSGQVTIRLNVEVLNNKFQQVVESARLEDTVQIQVFEQLELLHPRNGNLLLPHHTYTKIQTNRDQTARVSYEIISSCSSNQNNIITISKLGQISAFSTSGTVNVRVVVLEDFGFNQTALVQVEVKPIASVTLVSQSPFVNMEESRPSFPVGSNAAFGVTLHDATGRLFDVSNVPLKYRVSRFDVLQVVPDNENATFVLKGAGVGETIFKVWSNENPGISDYIRVKIAEAIHPRKLSLMLGAVECFSTPLQTDAGQWSSAGTEMSIGQRSGVAIGMSVGTTMVYYNNDQFSTYTEVIITSPTHNPSIADDDYLIVSNAHKTKNFEIILNGIRGSSVRHLCSDKTSLNEALKSPFLCIASWIGSSESFSVTDVFDVVSTYKDFKPVCEFNTKELSPAREKQLSVFDGSISLSVQLMDQKSSMNWQSDPVQVRFISDIYITEQSLSLSNVQKSHVFDIFGSESQLSGLQISTDSSHVRVEFSEENSQTNRHRYQIILEKVPIEDINVGVKLYSPLTKATRILPILIRGEPSSSDVCVINKTKPVSWREFFYSIGDNGLWIVAYTIIIATIILILMFYHSIVKGRQNPPFFPQSPFVHGHSPYAVQSSPPPYQSHSPSPVGYQSPGYTPGSYGKPNTPQRTLFSVSQ